MADDTNIQLLAQRLEAQEKLNSEQSKQLRDLRTKIDLSAGAEVAREKSGDWVKKLAPTIFGGIILSGVAFIWGQSVDGDTKLENKIGSISETQVEMRVIDGSRDKEIERVNARLNKLEAKKSSDTAPIDARLVAVESEVKRLDYAVVEHEEEIDHLEDDVSEQQKKLGSISASATASFTEVETQIRSTWDVINTMEAHGRQTDGILYKKVFGEDLPENDYFSTNIPAQATTQIGKVNGD